MGHNIMNEKMLYIKYYYYSSTIEITMMMCGSGVDVADATTSVVSR